MHWMSDGDLCSVPDNETVLEAGGEYHGKRLCEETDKSAEDPDEQQRTDRQELAGHS